MMNKRKLKIITIFYIAIQVVAINAQNSLESPIKSLLQNSYSPVAISTGGIASQNLYPFEGAFYNPALLSVFERQGGFANFAYGNDLVGGSTNYVIPEMFNIANSAFGFNFVYLQSSASSGIQNYAHLSISYSKKINNSLSFGLKIKPLYGKGADGSYFGLGVDPAFSFTSGLIWPWTSGFGIYDLTFYAMPQNLNINFGSGNYNDLTPQTSFHLGMHTGFFRRGIFGLDLYFEGAGRGSFSTFPFTAGTRFKIDFISLRAGYSFDSESVTTGLNLGMGMDFEFNSGKFFLNYGMVNPSQVGRDFYHFVSAGFSYGALDNEAPVVKIKTDNLYFSPNYDGVQDYIHFDLDIEDASPIKEWKLTIFNKNDKVVKVFTNDSREKEEEFGVTQMMAHLFKTRESITVPAMIRWDGTGDAIDIKKARSSENKAENRRLSQGTYYYLFETIDIRNNISRPAKGQVTLDVTSPRVQTNIEQKLFSPNGDGALDELIIMNESVGEEEDTWQIKIKNEQGVVVKSFNTLAGNRVPDVIKWTGKDNTGNDVAEGLYTYQVVGFDTAGNRTNFRSQQITLVRTVDRVDILVSSSGFSPNGDKVMDEIVFTPKVTSSEDLISWKISITSSKPNKEKELPNGIISWSGISAKDLPKVITWNGRNKKNKLALDGKYYITLATKYRSGNHPHSFSKALVIDNSAPMVNVEADLATFSPDGDGDNEEQVFRLDIQDFSPMKSFKMLIYEVIYNSSTRTRRVAKKFSGKKSYPKKIFWDGKTDKGNLVESATFYEYEIVATDNYGNKGVSRTGRFETDILVLVTERGLRIRLSNIEFGAGQARIESKIKHLLKKLARLLMRYKKYKIRVDGHTDDIGDEIYNQKLSEKRAKAVMDFLISTGVDKEKLNFQGLGEVYPLVPNKNKYNRSRNRRVEFILLKK